MVIYIVELGMILMLGILLNPKITGHKFVLCSREMNKTIFLTLTFTMMALVLGLRGERVGEDTAHYLSIFEFSQNVPWERVFNSGTDIIYNTVWDVDLKVEVGYMALNKVVGLFTDNGQWTLFIVACITCILFAKFIFDNFSEPFFPTYIFLCESMYMQLFNPMRQMLALSIGIQAYTSLKKSRNGSYTKAVLIILVACLFHKSAVVLLALIPLCLIKEKQKAIKYIFFAAAILPFLIPVLIIVVSRLIPRWSSYLTTSYWEADAGGIIILWLVEIIICGVVYINKIREHDKETFIVVACTVFYLSFELMGLSLTMFSRVALFFRIFLLFLFPLCSRFLRGKTKLVYNAVVLLLLAMLYISYVRSETRIYQFFWS